MSTIGERIEENANLIKWCVNILGPDDVMAAPSHDAAVIYAREWNRREHRRLRHSPNDILYFAHPAPWPHDEASHAESLKTWCHPHPTSEPET